MLISSTPSREGAIGQNIYPCSGLIQKGVQAGLYHYVIRHKVPERTRRGGASWYLKIISLFNFSMWTISVVDGNKGMQQYINTLLDGGFGSVLSAVYAALIIDYRLLCCFLFAELAFKVGCFWDGPGGVSSAGVEHKTGLELWRGD